MVVTVKASSRIHLGLMDMGRVTGRTFGGLGFMIDEPFIEAIAYPSDQLQVICPSSLDDSTRPYLLARVQQLLELSPGPPACIELIPRVLEHVGLGSKTSMTLAVLTAAAYATNRPLIRSTVQHISGRGGASGIGIHGFFTGGFLVDSGRRGDSPFLPSSLLEPKAIPTLIINEPMPTNWKVTLILPPGTRRAGQVEAALFERSTPIPRHEILEQFAVVYHGMVPALLEGDLETLGKALARFSALGFKAREIAEQDPAVAGTISALQNIAPCVGMSSMGPLVFCITEDTILDKIPELPNGTSVLGETTSKSTGFKISYA
jgi:beta-ribofuranosylaminobenzene 5'-phosphate synthase